MAKAPAVQFYSGDFLTGTTLMTNEEVGLYIRLLCLQAENGSVPDDPERMSAVYGPSVLKVWPAVRAKFVAGQEAGTMVNEKMSKVLADREAFRLKQSEKGKASAEARLKSGSKKKKPRFNNGSTVVEPLGDRDRDNTQGRKERASENDERFESLWKIYEGKGAKGKAREYWAKLTEEDRGAILAKAPAYVASTSGDDLTYRKNLEGWINPAERRWEAPIISRKVEAPKPRVWTKAEAIEEVRRIRDLHGKDFQTHHVPKDVLQAYRQTA